MNRRRWSRREDEPDCYIVPRFQPVVATSSEASVVDGSMQLIPGNKQREQSRSKKDPGRNACDVSRSVATDLSYRRMESSRTRRAG
jgi:hypothetical protein